MKANSLGILDAAAAHEYFGPAQLYWEGGYAGERKIQDVRPLLSIKRSNADWETIALKRLYQYETIDWLMSKWATPQDKKERDRSMDGLIKIHANEKEAESLVVEDPAPFTAILGKDKHLYFPFRPKGTGSDRSSIALWQLTLNQDKGNYLGGVCWVCPIGLSNVPATIYPSLQDVSDFVDQFVLMMPCLDNTGSEFINMYNAIGHEWTEWDNTGAFDWFQLKNNSVFKDWTSTEIK